MYDQGPEFECHGRERNAICVYGVGNIAHIMNLSADGSLVANKFMTEVDSAVVPCLHMILD